jgi:acetamidase/formamidase
VHTVIEPGPGTARWGHFDGTLPPIATVDQGEPFTIATLEGRIADRGTHEPSAAAARALRASGQPVGPGPHIVTGPVAVRGVAAGGALAVDLVDICLDSRYGTNLMVPGRGLLPELADEEHLAVLRIDPDTATVVVPPGITVHLQPFFGILATAPPPEWGVLDTRPPRANGGNIDCRRLTRGSRVLLPVFVDGAGLLVGDGHGAQGDGEVDMNAVETALRGLLTARGVPGLLLPGPVAVTADHLITFGFDEDLLGAARQALSRLLDLLHDHCGMTSRDAYRLASIVVDLHVTQVVNGVRGVHALLPRSVLDQLGPPEWVSCPADGFDDPGGPA